MKYKITSKFMQKESFRTSPHNGIDLKMEIGEPLRSIKSGTIRLADYGNSNAGKTVFVEWDDGSGTTAIYGHLSQFAVKDGQHVNAGELIGYAGNTGFSTGSHLHFGIKKDGQYLDPSPYIEDLQNMNVSQYFVQQVAETKLNFFHFMQQHMDLISGFISNVKLNFIHLLSTDYSPFIKIIQNIVQFIFLNS